MTCRKNVTVTDHRQMSLTEARIISGFDVTPFKFRIQRVKNVTIYSEAHRAQICIFFVRENIKLWVKWHCLTTLAILCSEVHVLYFLLIYFFTRKGINECEINWRDVRVKGYSYWGEFDVIFSKVFAIKRCHWNQS